MDPLQPTNQPPHRFDPRLDHGGDPGFAEIPGHVGAPEPARSSGRRRVARALVLVALGCLVAVAGVAAWSLRQFDQITKVSVAGVVSADGPENWLLVGTDSRAGINPDDPNAGAFLGEEVSGNRTDTMMILRVDRDRGRADLLSVPRDLWVPIAGEDRNGRVNGAFNGDGGRERLVATLSGALGLPINQYVEVDFVGFQGLVDAVGGVPVWFDRPARDVGSGLVIAEAGCHVLDGSQGLAFARARTFEELVDGTWWLEPTGDLGRTGRQREFLTRLMAAVGDRSIFSQVGLLDDVLEVVGEHVVLGDEASTGDLIALARSLSSIGPQQIVSHSLPVEDFRTSGGAQVLRLNETDAAAVLDLFRNGQATAGPVLDGETDAAADSLTTADQSETAQQTGAVAVSETATAADDSLAAGYGSFGFTAATNSTGTRCE